MPIGPYGPAPSFRRGDEHGAIETFNVVARFLDPATREVLRAWIEGRLHMADGGAAQSSADLAVENVSRPQGQREVKAVAARLTPR